METPINSLPRPIMSNIFQLLNKPNLRTCREVCAEWKRIIEASSTLLSSTAYVIDKSFRSIEPLLSTSNPTIWPTLRFIGCLQMGRQLMHVPAQILNTVTAIHASECVISRKCLDQILSLSTLTDLRLSYCHLENAIFQQVNDHPLKIHCLSLRKISFAMTERDIGFLSEILLPHVKSLVSLKIQELSRYSILAKLSPYQIKEDFYEFSSDSDSNDEEEQVNLYPDDTGQGQSQGQGDEDGPEPQLDQEFAEFGFPPGFGFVQNPFLTEIDQFDSDSDNEDEYEEPAEESEVVPMEIDDNENEQNLEIIVENLNPTVHHFMDAMINNAKTLRKIDFSFVRSNDDLNIQLFTAVIPAMTQAKVQLRTLILNSGNIPLRNNLAMANGDQKNPPMDFRTIVVNNLKKLLRGQIKLERLTLGLKQIHPGLQFEILKEIPSRLEILTFWPINIPQNANPLGHLPNLRQIHFPADSGGFDTWVNGQFNSISTGQQMIRNSGLMPKLKSFRGQMFECSDDIWNFFTNLTELDIQCYSFADKHVQLVIQHIKGLKRLALTSARMTDSGITGINPEYVTVVKETQHYQREMESLILERDGLPLSDLIYLEEIKFTAFPLSDFGIHFGLSGLNRLKSLDFNSNFARLEVTDWGLRILAPQLKHLEVLRICLNHKVTEEGALTFATSLKCLDHRKSDIIHVYTKEFLKGKIEP